VNAGQSVTEKHGLPVVVPLNVHPTHVTDEYAIAVQCCLTHYLLVAQSLLMWTHFYREII